MYCKKCGFKIPENETKCPFCNHDVNEEVSSAVIKETIKEEYKEEVVVDKPVEKQEYVNINKTADIVGIRNKLGYLELKTQFWHHVLIACLGYLLMNVSLILIARMMVSAYVSNGMDFSCINSEAGIQSCPIEVSSAYMIISCVSQVIAELLIVVVTALIFMKYLKPFFKQFKDSKTWKWVGIGFGLMYGLNLVYSILLQLFEQTSTSTNQDLVNQTIFNNPVLGFLFVVIAAPLFEEIIFRFGIFRAFTGKGKKREIIGIVVTTLLFAFVHMTPTLEAAFVDISNPDWKLFFTDMLSLPAYLIGAFSLTFAYYKSKNLLTSMLMHMAWNFIAFVGIITTGVIEPNQSTQVIVNLFNTIVETLTRLF